MGGVSEDKTMRPSCVHNYAGYQKPVPKYFLLDRLCNLTYVVTHYVVLIFCTCVVHVLYICCTHYFKNIFYDNLPLLLNTDLN